MKILYDHQVFSIQKYGGATKYFCELIQNLPAGYESNLSILLSDNQYLKENYEFFKKKNIPLPDKPFKGKDFLKKKIYYLNKQYSRRSILANNYDLFHPTYYDDYFFEILKKPYIITVHDLIAFKFENKNLKNETIRLQMEKVIKNANRIISISQNTKTDTIDMFNIDPEKIDVIYHGYKRQHVKNPLNRYGRYILFVGRRNGYKNFKTFLNAVSSLLRKENDLKVICVGEPFNKKEIAELTRLKVFEQTTSLTVDEDSLNSLYSNAQLFVYPSLYEGFGMPILEAFANNCPVCLSNTSCFPEISGNAGVYFDPNDQESILEAVQKILYDTDYKNQIINAGKERLTDFSWEKTAQETVDSYKKALVYKYF